MARFEIQANGKRFEVEAPDMQSAVAALSQHSAQSLQDRFATAFSDPSETTLSDLIVPGRSRGPDPELQRALDAKATGKPPAGFSDVVNNAVTFGLSKDAAALAHAGPREIASWFSGEPYNFGEEYGRAREGERARIDQYSAENPVSSGVANVIGAVGSLGNAGVGAARAGLSAGQRLWQGVKEGAKGGAVIGGLAGFGDAKGDIVDRGISAGEGAAFGAGLGAAIPVATTAVGAVAKPAIDAVRARINPGGAAARKVVDRMTANGRDIESAARRIESAGQLGVNLNLADVGPRQAKNLARTVANIPGPGGDRIAAKANITALSQGERVKRFIGEVFGSPGSGYQAAKATIMDARSNAAKPLYERAYATPVPFTFELEGLLNTPAGRAGLSAAKRNSANRREPWAQWFANVAGDGSIINAKRVPDTRALDEVKRVLDNMVEGAKRPADGSPFAKALATPESIAIQSVRDDLVNFLRNHNPAYRQALKVGGDNIRANEALEFGRNALKEDSRVIARKMGDPTAYGRDKVFDEGERELARVGLAEALRDKIDNAGFTQNTLSKFFGNREQIARLRPFFKSQDDFTRFRGQILVEARKRSTVDFIFKNSTTARQLADLQEAGQMGEGVQIAADVARGGVTSAILKTLHIGLRRFGGLTPQVADHISRLLMTSDPQAVRGILTEIRRIEASNLSAQAKRGQIRAILSRLAAGQVGGGLGSRPSEQPAPIGMLPAPTR